MKVLITCFEPFGGEKINPSSLAVDLLSDEIGGAQIEKLHLPVMFGVAAEVIEQCIKSYKPDIILSIGQAGGRAQITIERVAINLREASIPDNDGNMPVDEKIEEHGENAYFATLPVKAMVNAVRECGVPCALSYTAGSYVCNDVMYSVLHMCNTKYKNIKAGFIHIPYAFEQVANKGASLPAMSVEVMAKALHHAVLCAVNGEEDKTAMGTTH